LWEVVGSRNRLKEKFIETLAMEDESVHNNPRDPAEERFERLEAQVVDIKSQYEPPHGGSRKKILDHSEMMEALTQRSDWRGN
jgi:hypothetical protein